MHGIPLLSNHSIRRMNGYPLPGNRGIQAVSDFAAYDLDDVDAGFRLHPRWTELRYSQKHLLLPPAAPGATAGEAGAAGAAGGGQGPAGGGIAITPLPAGRYPGGAVWRLTLLGSGQEVVYAVDFNHRKER